MDTPPDRRAQWAAGIPFERWYWTDWLRTRGGEWADDFRNRLDPAAPLTPFVADAVWALGQERVRILDVGAGPLTWIGYRLPGVALDIVPVDPLAPLYAELLAARGLQAPIATRLATAEELTLFFPEGGFDLVHCRNALDHAQDPLAGLRQMLAVTRPGGRVLLDHFEDEGVQGSYQGFHQWNFSLRDGRFVIWNAAGTIDVAKVIGCPCTAWAGAGARQLLVMIERQADWVPPAPIAGSAAAVAAAVERLIAAAPVLPVATGN